MSDENKPSSLEDVMDRMRKINGSPSEAAEVADEILDSINFDTVKSMSIAVMMGGLAAIVRREDSEEPVAIPLNEDGVTTLTQCFQLVAMMKMRQEIQRGHSADISGNPELTIDPEKN